MNNLGEESPWCHPGQCLFCSHMCVSRKAICALISQPPRPRELFDHHFMVSVFHAFQLVMSRNSFTTTARMGCNRFHNFWRCYKEEKGERSVPRLFTARSKNGRLGCRPTSHLSDNIRWEEVRAKKISHAVLFNK